MTTCARVSFSRGSALVLAPGAVAIDPDTRALQEFQLRSRQNKDIGSLQETIQSLKDVDAWDTLDRVDVQECEVLDYDSASAVVGKERLLRSV